MFLISVSLLAAVIIFKSKCSKYFQVRLGASWAVLSHLIRLQKIFFLVSEFACCDSVLLTYFNKVVVTNYTSDQM